MQFEREFWILVVDIIISAVAYFGAKYLAPDVFEDVQFVVLAVQPIVVAVIGKLYADRKTAEITAFTEAKIESLSK
jgi:hypothetical protein